MKLRKELSFRVLSLLLGTLVSLIGAEIILRWTKPYKTHQAARELRNFREGGEAISALFEVDEEIGFRPRLGSEIYSEWGTRVNGYRLEKDPSRERLLFIGDSVTFRAEIVNALTLLFGEERFEYWNAGVESFNTLQEVAFYRRYNRKIDADHIVLTFHLNDFQTTPIAFRDEEGNLVVYAPHRSSLTINKRLFKTWHLYRLYIGLRTNRQVARQRVAEEVKAALATLQSSLAPSVRFTVLIFPILSPYEDWTADEQWAHQTVSQALEDLAIESFDLLPSLESALEASVPVRETPEDPWHPSAAFGAHIARDLESWGFLSTDSASSGEREGELPTRWKATDAPSADR